MWHQSVPLLVGNLTKPHMHHVRRQRERVGNVGRKKEEAGREGGREEGREGGRENIP